MNNSYSPFFIFMYALLVLAMHEAIVPHPAEAATFNVTTPAQLSSALAAAQSNGQDDIIRIAQGSYTGNFLYSSHEEKSLTLQGGWTFDFASRVVQPANTVLDGEKKGTVLAISSDKEVNLTIEGITIQNGYIKDHDGGGLFISNYLNEAGEPNTTTIRNCTVRSNISETVRDLRDGGGIYLWTSTKVVIAHNTISGNSAFCEFEGCWSGKGGGIFVETTKTLDINNNLIYGNRADKGGGIWANSNWWNIPSNEKNTIRANIIRDNQAAGTYGDGGGMYLMSYNPTSITDNIISNNNSGRQGGGVFLNVYANQFTLANNVLAGNNAGTSGGGMCAWARHSFNMTNNTVVDNQAGSHGGGLELVLYDDTTVANLSNNIIWRNDSFNPGRDLYIENDPDDNYLASICNLYHNDFNQSGWGTFMKISFVIPASNLNGLDPLFVQPAAGNYRLAAGSPCLNSGSNTAPSLPATDIEGKARIQDQIVDMGAYEGSFARKNSPVIPPLIMLLK
jgi:Right handed beta helix region